MLNDSRTLIIAEAGVNHNGELDIAREMIKIAADVGADIIKFQTFFAGELTTKDAKKAEYQTRNDPGSKSQLEMLLGLELSWNDHKNLKKHCREQNIEFLSTAFSISNLEKLIELGIRRIKIPSGEITNLPLLRYISKRPEPVILSTGMSTEKEVAEAVSVLQGDDDSDSKKDITILQCNSAYPTPVQDVNLCAMSALHKIFGYPVGYSDHTLGINASLAAVAMGAVIIEKHFTLNRSMSGPDHLASLEPEELKKMISSIREIEKMSGSDLKKITASEKENRISARRSIVAAMAIKSGSQFTQENLTVKRPGNGISPMLWDKVIGTTARKDFEVDDLIEL